MAGEIVLSPHPDVTVPDVPLHEFVLADAMSRADQEALVDGPTGRTLTYGQLAGGVRRVAAGLAARGFAKGEVFAIYSPNVPEYALAFYGVSAASGVNTTISPSTPSTSSSASSPTPAPGSCSPCPRSWTRRWRRPAAAVSRRCSCSARARARPRSPA